ncbi:MULTISPECIES: NrtA/SsuA/CpmA family ABC transporter substrate-binding protein [unclassified Janthinobacterium]|uniref:ABC transporter substrate-binding protein n=1 Tax=unclassified Janthinobacterium TaxID=2610881 RepID=UPI0018C98ED1|nr:NrtA/SsuA/CpmA family ABC transporter substrate-binding protein [Janthinobacterium sp. CG_23.4]MDH6158267.1 NitT/TauT family transport system substrate-binding protein [Janthinobacterium sp. CG_23.4]
MNRMAPARPMIWLAAIALLLALAVAAIWRLKTHAVAPPGPVEVLRLAVNVEYVGSCPVLAARAHGYFAREGIDALLQPYSSGKASLQAVLQGRAELSTVSDIPVVLASLNQQSVVIIASIFEAERDHGIVGRLDRGVSTPASLKGKRIGVTLGTSGHFTLDAFLNRQKLLPGEVTLRNYAPEQLAGALARGEIDAAAGWEPFLAGMTHAIAGNAAIFYGEDVYAGLFNVAGGGDYVRNHPATMRKVLRALLAGARFCRDEPEAARALFPNASASEAARLQAAWHDYQFAIVLDQRLLLALEDEARWAIKNRLAERSDMPNFLDAVYLDALEDVAPSAMTVIH